MSVGAPRYGDHASADRRILSSSTQAQMSKISTCTTVSHCNPHTSVQMLRSPLDSTIFDQLQVWQMVRWPRTARLTRHLTFNCSAGSLITCTFSRVQPRSRCILYMQRNILMPLLRKFVPFRPIKRLLLSVLYMIIRRESPETSRNDEKEWSRDVPQQPISTRRRRVCLVCGASTWLEIVFQWERI